MSNRIAELEALVADQHYVLKQWRKAIYKLRIPRSIDDAAKQLMELSPIVSDTDAVLVKSSLYLKSKKVR